MTEVVATRNLEGMFDDALGAWVDAQEALDKCKEAFEVKRAVVIMEGNGKNADERKAVVDAATIEERSSVAAASAACTAAWARVQFITALAHGGTR